MTELDVQLAPQTDSRRWIVCALLFAATTLNYMDRQIIGVLKPVLQAQLRWSEVDYGSIIFWFQLAYAVGLVGTGRWLDWLGVRRGYAASVALWSLAAASHGLVRTVGGFSIARVMLGVGEAANFPAAVKAVSIWFPKAERALATGIFNAGANVGALATVLCVPPLTLAFGWQMAFVVTGALGFLWLILWLIVYRESARQNADADQRRAVALPQVDWKSVLRLRQTWAFAAGKFLTDPIWWFFLFWLPDYFGKVHGLTLLTFGAPLVVIYLLSDLGSVAGGALSSLLIARGWSLNSARKTAMLVCALCVTPIGLAAETTHLWFATGLIGLAAAAHQGWSANLLTLPADTIPNRLVGSVVGFGGMIGAIGGMLMARYAGYVLDRTGDYRGLFMLIGGSYLLALAIIHLLAPRLESAQAD